MSHPENTYRRWKAGIQANKIVFDQKEYTWFLACNEAVELKLAKLYLDQPYSGASPNGQCSLAHQVIVRCGFESRNWIFHETLVQRKNFWRSIWWDRHLRPFWISSTTWRLKFHENLAKVFFPRRKSRRNIKRIFSQVSSNFKVSSSKWQIWYKKCWTKIDESEQTSEQKLYFNCVSFEVRKKKIKTMCPPRTHKKFAELCHINKAQTSFGQMTFWQITICQLNNDSLGREPWSSGYGWETYVRKVLGLNLIIFHMNLL